MNSTSITFVQLNDLHGQLLPHPELFWDAGRPILRQHFGGLAKVTTWIKQRKARDPSHTLVVDCGDAFFGSYFTHIEQGRAIAELLNSVGIDASNGGHWEYFYGPKRFLELASLLQYPLYAVNIYEKASHQRIFSPYGIFERAGIRVAVFGLAATIVDESMPPSFSENLLFTDGLADDELPALIAQAREQADLICLSSHMGLPQDIAIAKRIPGIDVILSGHTHDRLTQPVIVPTNKGSGQTIVIQSGFSGSFIGELTLNFTPSEAGITISSIAHQLHRIDEEVSPDAHMQHEIDKLYDAHREKLNEPLGETQCDLHRMLTFETPMDNLILLSMQDACAADIYVARAWRFGPPKSKGMLYERDLWDMVPMKVNLFTSAIQGSTLLAAAEAWLTSVMTTPLKQQGGYVTRQLGAHIIVRINNPDGFRIEAMYVGDQPIDLQRMYWVVIAGDQVKQHLSGEWTPLELDLHTVIRNNLRKGPINAGLTHDKWILS
ncbi:MAG: 5'-nucleotidase C-terminal domain-containing protein [Firmicutes bacterium]|nr:5'-nucleotidase C-terminal domain-containing protein [Bacillota bacterium]